jgi:hypothetical protein
VLVEQTIGALKMRFPILKNTIRIRRKNVGVLIFGCAIIHNFLNAANILIPDY